MRRLAYLFRTPRRCCLGPLLTRRLLVWENLVHLWMFASIGLFARVVLYFSMSWKVAFTCGLRGSRGLCDLRGIVFVGATLARLMLVSSRVLTRVFVTWRWVSSHVMLGLPRRRSTIFSEKLGSNVFAPLALFSVAGFLIADVVVVVKFVIAVVHTAVSKVVLFVASGGGGSQARPIILAIWRSLAGRRWHLRIFLVRVAMSSGILRSARMAGERGGVSATTELACGLASWAPFCGGAEGSSRDSCFSSVVRG